MSIEMGDRTIEGYSYPFIQLAFQSSQRMMDGSGKTETGEENTNAQEHIIPKTIDDAVEDDNSGDGADITELKKKIDKLTKRNEDLEFSQWGYDQLKEENDALKKHIEDAKEEFTKLQYKKERLANDYRELKQHRSSSGQSPETEALREQNKQLADEVKLLESDKDRITRENSKLKTKVSDFNNVLRQNSELTSNNKKLEEEQSKLKTDLSDQKFEFIALKRKLNITEKDVTEHKRTNKDLLKQLEENKNKTDILNNNFKDITTKNEELKAVNITFENKMKEYQEKIERLGNEINILKVPGSSANKTISGASAEHIDSKFSLQELQQNLDTALKSVDQKEQEIKDLQNKLSVKEIEHTEIKNKYEELQQDMKESQRQNQTLQQTVSNLDDTYKCSQSNLQEQKSENSETKSEITNLKSKLKTENDEKEDAVKPLAESRQEITRLQDIVDSYQPRYEEVLKREEEWRNEWHALIEEQRDCRQERQNVDKQRLELDQMKISTKEKELELFKRRAEMLQQEEKMKNTIKILKTDLTTKVQSSIELQTQLDSADEQLSNYSANLTDANEKVIALNAEIQAKNEILAGQAGELSKLQELCDKMRHTENDLREENNRLVEERIRLTTQMLKERENLGKSKAT